MKKNIPQATLERLPLYYRAFAAAGAEGTVMLSSKQLGEILESTPVQVRKDLAACGNFGIRGFGYPVEDLKNNIGKILGLPYNWRLAIVGAGHLGIALANYKNFSALGFQLAALFDRDERIIGSEVNGVKIYDFAKIKSVALRKRIDIGVIAVPEIYAQEVADALVSANVRGIWNFAPTKIVVPPEISLVNEDLSVGLSILSFHMRQKEK